MFIPHRERAETASASETRRERRLCRAAVVTTLLTLSFGSQASADPAIAKAAPETAPTETQTVTKTETVTPPPKTTTVKAPTQTNTVIKTETTTLPSNTSTTDNHHGAAAAAGAAAARGQEPESEEGLPGWAWGLIGFAVGGAAIGAVSAYHHRHDLPPGPAGPGPTPRGPPPGM